jgi:hypothetical protein
MIIFCMLPWGSMHGGETKAHAAGEGKGQAAALAPRSAAQEFADFLKTATPDAALKYLDGKKQTLGSVEFLP